MRVRRLDHAPFRLEDGDTIVRIDRWRTGAPVVANDVVVLQPGEFLDVRSDGRA